jgi:hypothetical protein
VEGVRRGYGGGNGGLRSTSGFPRVCHRCAILAHHALFDPDVNQQSLPWNYLSCSPLISGLAGKPLPMNPGNIQQQTSNAQLPMPAPRVPIRCSMLDVGCWMASPLRFRGSTPEAFSGCILSSLPPRCRHGLTLVLGAGKSGATPVCLRCVSGISLVNLWCTSGKPLVYPACFKLPPRCCGGIMTRTATLQVIRHSQERWQN